MFELDKIIRLFAKRITSSVADDDHPDEAENAHSLSVIFYVTLQIGFYKTNKDFLPTKEFALLIECIKTASSISMLRILLSQLITVNDILCERQPNSKDERFQTIFKTIETVDNYAFYNLNPHTALAKSPTTRYFRETLQKPIQPLEQWSAKFSGGGWEYLISCIFNKKNIEGIKNSYRKMKDKKAFAKDFLSQYITLYKGSYFAGEKYLFAKNIPLVTLILAEQISSEEFQEILKNLHEDLEVFQHQLEEDETPHFNLYKFTMACYNNNLTLFPEEDESWFLEITTDLKKIKNVEHLYNILENVKILSTYAATQITKQNQNLIKNESSVIRILASQKSIDLQPSLENFFSLFNRINQNATTHHQRDTDLFFLTHYPVVSQVIDTMGLAGVHYLQKHLAGTVLTLERALIAIPVLPQELCHLLKEYFRLSLFKQPDDILELFKTIMIALGALLQTDISSISDITCTIENKEIPQKLLLLITKKLLAAVLPSKKIEHLSDMEINKIFERMAPKQFVQLAVANQRMEEDEYREIFLEMLSLDLLQGDVDNFLHHVEQENKIGRDLARHNQTIRNKLRAYQIKPELALEYTKKLDFVVCLKKNDRIAEENILFVLWSYLIKLEVEALKILSSNTLEKNQTKKLNKIVKNIQDFKKNSGEKSSKKEIVEALKSKQHLMKPLKSNLINLGKAKTTSTFKEFSKHVKAQIELYQKTGELSNPKLNTYCFSIEQWPKKKAQTYFLGDAVGCCLATTNERFPAMNQRRMDDAFLFHVVIDKRTQCVAALLWLCFEETAEGKLPLIINFPEVHAKYGIDNTLRLSILNNLLGFTYQYCKDNGIGIGPDPFYMNQVTYGWNIHDFSDYPLVHLNIVDKLGGPYVPYASEKNINMDEIPMEEKKAFTKSKYYLTSLEQDQFHRFDPLILQAKKTAEARTKEELIMEVISSLDTKKMDVDRAKIAIKEAVGSELALFYTSPLEADPSFISDIELLLNKAILQKASASLRAYQSSTYAPFITNPSFATEPHSHIVSENICTAFVHDKMF